MDKPFFKLGQDTMTTGSLYALACSKKPAITMTDESWKKIEYYSEILQTLSKSKQAYYGINTGFGILANVRIPPEDLLTLQLNLVRSHACGMGDELEPLYVRAMMVTKVHNFAQGHSGVSRACVQTLLDMLEKNIIPVVYSQGSVGASGDLAPLAHIALAMLGEGEVWDPKGQKVESSKALKKAGIALWSPAPKEGLSLINGTHMMSSMAAIAIEKSINLAKTADLTVAMSLDAVKGSLSPFVLELHKLKPHAGQIAVARNFAKIFVGSDEILHSHSACSKVQDPYSFRCVPQVHGAVRLAIDHVRSVVETELNSITDNPLIMEDGKIISGGHFHGEALAMTLDYLAIAISELGNISQCRIDKLTKPQLSQQPVFLSKNPGLNSGFMIPQTVAAAIASENKVLSHPASVDSIPTNVDQEDHVSMGPISANKALKVIENTEKILAIELLCAAQGVELLQPLKPNSVLQNILDRVRQYSAFLEEDRPLYKDMQNLQHCISRREIVDVANIDLD